MTWSPAFSPLVICVCPFKLSPSVTDRLPNWFARCGGVDEGLVLGVAQDGGVRQRDGILDRARVYGGGTTIHVFLQLLAGIVGVDACLQRARRGIE